MSTYADAQIKISRLEAELTQLRQQLQGPNGKDAHQESTQVKNSDICVQDHKLTSTPPSPLDSLANSNLHSLLILTDSALPLGSFAFSSGLESLLAHQPKAPRQPALQHFLRHSLASVARLTAPYLLQAHRTPSTLSTIDNDLDASTPCTVARRASVAQGRALLANWERALRTSTAPSAASAALAAFSRDLRLSSPPEEDVFAPCGHLAPVFGVVAAALGLAAYLAVYSFLLNHVKAVLSAAIRASVLGPFQAQAVLSSGWLREEIHRHADMAQHVGVEDAGQVWVPGDVWIGRHELLYSRIFNS